MIKLSEAGKMPCKSFSLQAIETCPGMFLPSGEVKAVCSKCYATRGNYLYPVVKNARKENLQETYKSDFALNLVEIIKKEKSKFFRWFDSGDIYSNNFLIDVFAVCLNTPKVQHWIPTKSRELFDQKTWETLESLPNVRVRFSSDSINGDFEPFHGSTVIQKNMVDSKQSNLFKPPQFSNEEPGKVYTCPAGKQGGKCNACRACWSKKIEVVAYVLH